MQEQSSIGAGLSAPQEWRAGWKLVLAAAIGFSFVSTMTTGMGAFMQPLADEFGWSRTLVSAGLPIAGLVTVLLAPFAGLYVDRIGCRKMALPGLFLMIGSTAAFSLTNGSPVQWLFLWIIYALVSLTVAINVWSTAIAGAFTTARGLALGLTLAGTGLAQAIMPIFATTLIDSIGWRGAFLALAFGWGGIAFVLCLLFFHDRRILAPWGKKAVAAAATQAAQGVAAASVPAVPGLTIPEALRDSKLWRIALSTFLLMILTIGLLIHQIPILTELGVTRTNAAMLAGLGGVAGIIGKLVTGTLIDRYRANWVGGITLATTAMAFGFLLDGIRTPTLVVVAVLVNGYSAGTKLQICSYLTSRFAGLRNYGTIFGAMGSLIALGSALGPLAAGMIYDMTGGYTPFMIAGTIGCLISGLVIFTLPDYPVWENEEADPA